MDSQEEILKRRSIRLINYDYSQAGWYFVTICILNRECLLGEVIHKQMILNTYGHEVEQKWKSILERYIVMPNHIHGIIVITKSNNFVGAIHELPLQQKNENKKNNAIAKDYWLFQNEFCKKREYYEKNAW